MNAIIFSAISGIVMMFCSVFISNTKAYRHVAAICLIILFGLNYHETYNTAVFSIDVHDMLRFSRFGYFFNSIIIVCTLAYVLLTGKDVAKTGTHIAEYFTLIFFRCAVLLYFRLTITC